MRFRYAAIVTVGGTLMLYGVPDHSAAHCYAWGTTVSKYETPMTSSSPVAVVGALTFTKSLSGNTQNLAEAYYIGEKIWPKLKLIKS
jgi:hypothetical protein